MSHWLVEFGTDRAGVYTNHIPPHVHSHPTHTYYTHRGSSGRQTARPSCPEPAGCLRVAAAINDSGTRQGKIDCHQEPVRSARKKATASRGRAARAHATSSRRRRWGSSARPAAARPAAPPPGPLGRAGRRRRRCCPPPQVLASAAGAQRGQGVIVGAGQRVSPLPPPLSLSLPCMHAPHPTPRPPPSRRTSPPSCGSTAAAASPWSAPTPTTSPSPWAGGPPPATRAARPRRWNAGEAAAGAFLASLSPTYSICLRPRCCSAHVVLSHASPPPHTHIPLPHCCAARRPQVEPPRVLLPAHHHRLLPLRLGVQLPLPARPPGRRLL